MSSSSASEAFDASNYPGFRDAVERESAGKKRVFWDDYWEGVVAMAMVLSALVYLLLTMDLTSMETALLAVACVGCFAAMVVFVASSLRRPSISPIRIMTDGTVTIGRRQFDLSSVGEIELDGHVLVFRNEKGRTLAEAYDYQAGNLEGFVSAARRHAPEIVVRVGSETMAPRLVRIPKV